MKHNRDELHLNFERATSEQCSYPPGNLYLYRTNQPMRSERLHDLTEKEFTNLPLNLPDLV